MYREKWKPLKMHKALHFRDYIDKTICVKQKAGGRGLASIKDNADASMQRLEDYIEKRGKTLIAATRNNTEETRTSRPEITRK